ncbi:MAG: recombination protein O N-terminal domain-containing protein [Candidatus Vogelbacteria bacterium]|nr:recombination protein O N-terminal domain-containing protein [Candidatus Vogelbacteria bacterium]
MSHLFHHTTGYIIASQDYGEANRLYQILTPDHGLVTVTAQGVRQLASKLRYHLKEFVELRLTLVRGREVWRLIGVEHRDPKWLSSAERLLAKRIFSLLKRLVVGEEKGEELYGVVHCLMTDLNSRRLDAEALYQLELATVLSTLRVLGYLPAGQLPAAGEVLVPAHAISLINRALQASQL